MAKEYSEDLRKRVLAAYDAGQTHKEVSQRFGVSIQFIQKLRALRDETGGITRRPRGGGMPRRLSSKDETAMRHWCKEKPDMTLKEYQQRLLEERGVQASIPTLSRKIRELGLTVKKSLSTRRSNGRRKTA